MFAYYRDTMCSLHCCSLHLCPLKQLLYTTLPKVGGHLLIKHLNPKSWSLIWSWSPLCSTLLGKLSTRHWNIAAGTCFHSATRALLRSGTDVGWLGLARIRRSNSSHRCLMGWRSGRCAGQSSYSTPILTNHFCMDLALCTGALSIWNRKGPSPNCCHKTQVTCW